MNQRRRLQAALFAAVFASSLLTSASAMAETLADAIAMAYESNPSLLRQRNAVQQADEVFYRAQRTLGPTVTADAQLTADRSYDSNPATGPNQSGRQSAAFGLNLSQSIYTGGRLSAQIKSQEASLLAQRESLRQAEASLVQNVIEAYIGVRRAEQTLAIVKDNVTVLQRQRDEAQARFEVGASTRTDVAQADSRLASSQSNLTQAQNSLDNAKAQYRTIVGQSPGTLEPEPSLAPLLPESAAIAFQAAQEDNPALRSAYLNERASAAGISAAKAARRPQVSATISAGYDPAIFGQRDDLGVTAGARISVPLFTGLTTSSSIRSAELANRSDEIAINSQIRSLQQQVTQSWNSLVSARATIESNEQGVNAAQLAYEGTHEEQEVGLRTTLDVLNAEQELRSSQQTLINSRASEYLAAASLLNAMGHLDAKTLSPTIDTYDPAINFKRVNSFGLPWEPLIRNLDRIGAAPIPEREPLPGEVVPDLPELEY
jgi:outer membrane protein